VNPDRRPRVVITQKPFRETLALLEDHRCEVWCPGQAVTPSRQTVIAQARDADAIMVFMTDYVDAAFLDACRGLHIVAGALKGFDNLDGRACAERGVWLSIVPDLLTAPTAELAVGLTIGIARQIRPADAHVRSGAFDGWQPRFYGTGIAGACVGIIGMGAVGCAIAERLGGFACRLAYTDPKALAPAAASQLGVQPVALDELLATSDFVILAVPLTPDTLHLINTQTLARMRPGAFLINPSRGSVVDEDAVLAALESGRLGGYAADVFGMEDRARRDRPATIAPRLREQPRTLFTPHIGSAVTDVRVAIEHRAAENILDALAGRHPRDAVNEPAQATSVS
jgi:phosphonate dehydrogenase